MLKSYPNLFKHLLGAGILLAFLLVYFYPMLQDYVIAQSDIKSYQGMASEMRAYRNQDDQEIFWSEAMFSGMPTYQTGVKYQFSVLQFLDLHVLKLGLYYAVMPLFVAMLGMYFLLQYFGVLWVLSLVGALLYAFSAYHLQILDAGHNSKLNALCYLPWLLFSFIFALKSQKTFLALLFVSVSSYYALAANHVQMLYYFLLFVGIYLVLAVLLRQMPLNKDFIKRLSIIFIGFLLALAGNFNLYYQTYSYAKHTMRGGNELAQATAKKGLDLDYITRWSYGKSETFSYLIADVKGKGSGSLLQESAFIENLDNNLRKPMQEVYENAPQLLDSYFGEQPFTAGPMYAGVVCVYVLLLLLFYYKSAQKWAFFAVFCLFVMLAWGRNFMGLTAFAVEYLPFYNKFRTPSSILAIVHLFIPFLAILGLNKLLEEKDFLQGKLFKILSFSLLGFLLLNAIKGDLFFATLKESELGIYSQVTDWFLVKQYVSDFRANIIEQSAWRSLFYVGIAFVLLYLYAKNNWQKMYVALALTLLMSMDILSIGLRYMNNAQNEKGKFTHWQAKKEFLSAPPASVADKSIYELENTKNPSIEKVYQDIAKALKNQYDTPKLAKSDAEQAQFDALRKKSHFRVFALGNSFNDAMTSFFHKSVGGYHPAKLSIYQNLIDAYLEKYLQDFSSAKTYEEIDEKLSGMNVLHALNTQYIILHPSYPALENPHNLGAAWFAKDIVLQEDLHVALDTLGALPLQTAMLHQNVPFSLRNGFDEQANISLLHYHPDTLRYKSTNQADGLAVFSEIYYPEGWTAYIDGKETPWYRANYFLRALFVPKGTHDISFVFAPKHLLLGRLLHLGFLAMLGVFAVLAFWQAKKKQA